jgi:hypothetical protein
MSTLQVSNIQATGETASRAVSGVAAAWVNFDGTGTVAVRDSMNVASLTDIGTGNYNVNFNNSFSSTSYGSFADGNTAVNGWNRNVCSMPDAASKSQLVSFYTHTDIKADFSTISVSASGDLA